MSEFLFVKTTILRKDDVESVTAYHDLKMIVIDTTSNQFAGHRFVCESIEEMENTFLDIKKQLGKDQ